MNLPLQWQTEPGPRLQGSRPLDASKVQAPCIVALPSGGYRLFYTAIGPTKPFKACQGYILSAFSDDGLNFKTEPGLRITPQPEIPHLSRRVLAPTISEFEPGHWRMYFEARGTVDQRTVICSAVSTDLLHWEIEPGIRIQAFEGVGGPRFTHLPNGCGRLYFFAAETIHQPGENSDSIRSQSIYSASTQDGLHFELEPGCRMRDKQADYDTAGITAAELLLPQNEGEDWTLFYSVWQDRPEGKDSPVHPSHDPLAESNGASVNFAEASIAADMSGYRSRIYTARSQDGLNWERTGCAIEGEGYDAEGLDAVHAEDMSLIRLRNGQIRMFYAACDKHGNWRIASAITQPPA